MVTNMQYGELCQELRVAVRVALELTNILRHDGVQFKKVKPRTLRWIKKQESILEQKMVGRDKMLRSIRERNEALAKLTLKEKILLGLPTD